MAVTRQTLIQLRGIRVTVGAEADQATRALTQAWAGAWRTMRTQWERAVADVVGHAVATGQAPAVWELNRLKRLADALHATEESLAKLADRAGVDMVDGAGRIVSATADAEPRLVSSQLPAAEQAAVLAQFTGSVTPTALDMIVARSQGQITSALRPLSHDAMNAVRRQLVRGIAAGDNPVTAARRMLSDVEGAFNGGLTRAVTIARTEMLDAYRATGREIGAANGDVVAGWIWFSALDDRTCFPAGTRIATARGSLPIEALRTGDAVLTHTGVWRPVTATMSRAYVGPLVTVQAGPLRVTATAEHPFLVERQGQLHWVQARHLRRGDCVFSDRERVPHRRDHGLGEVAVERRSDQPDHGEAQPLQVQGLFGVAGGDLRMPVGLVDLYRDTAEQEVDRPAPAGDRLLLDVGDAELVEAEADVALRLGLTGEAPVAAHRTEPLPPQGRDHTVPLATRQALDLDGRAAAHLGAVGVASVPDPEHGAAADTRPVHRLNATARDGTDRVPLRIAARDGEVGSALRAPFGDRGSGPVTGPGAVGLRERGWRLEDRAAVRASDGDPGLRLGAEPAVRMLALVAGVAGLTAETTRALADPSGRHTEAASAPLTRPFHRHIIDHVYDTTGALTVYNIEVADDHSYVADGFVVHNCAACFSMHGSEHPLSEPGPMDHAQGRCARMPKAKSWRDLGINTPEPPSAVPDGQAAFWGLPQSRQLAIMGPARLDLLRSGRIGWGDLAQRNNPLGWRPNYVPRPVDQLRALARHRAATGEPLRPPAPADPELAGRLQQAAIDQVRPLAQGLAEVEGLLLDEATDATLQSRLGSMVARHGDAAQKVVDAFGEAAGDRQRWLGILDDLARDHRLERIGRGGEIGPFNPRLHESVGGWKPRTGERVQIVRPGYQYRLDADELIRLFKAQVDEVDDGLGLLVPKPAAVRPPLPSARARELGDIIDGPRAPSVAEMGRWVNGRYGGLDAQVTSVTHIPGRRLRFKGDIFDQDNQWAGTFERIIKRDKNGTLTAEHVLLSIVEKFQGSGFQAEFNANLIAWYRRSGLKFVKVHANIDVGGYAWARTGYDFATTTTARTMFGRLEEKLATLERTLSRPNGMAEIRRLHMKGATEAEVRRQIAVGREFLATRVVKGAKLTDMPSAYELSQLGRWKGAGKDDVWIGKWVMLFSDWRGVLRL